MDIPIALQLHSVRDEAQHNLAGVLERTARIGYLGIEIGTLFGMAPVELRHRVDELGLQLVGAYGPFPPQDWELFLDDQEALANDVVVSGLLPDHFSSSDAIARAASQFNESGARARGRGMTLYYHPHWWEFGETEVGSVAFDDFLDRLDPEIGVLADIYWIKAGGQDPVATLSRYGSRVKRLHVKDGPGSKPTWPVGPPPYSEPQTAVGAGTLDIATILAAAPQVDWHVVELDDCAGDAFEAVEASYHYLIGEGLSRGRETD